ncbi:MAG: helix-turn-helix transcriptional regulator, partial [Clostridia bacterium]|nr:helix-turn-helix transcriptional regulator [Clostridia bacterium]
MFDTAQVGRKIAALRKAHNMTQYELADKLNISFQAVSNWERGNSMPDISKLPEIAALFDTTIDDILGTTNPILTRVAKGEAPEAIQHTVGLSEGMQILSEALPLLKPSQVSEMARATTSQGSIAPLLPFMDEEDVEKLLEQYESEGRSTSIFYPFLSDKKICELFERYRAEGKSISALLPFLDDDTLTSLAEEAFRS